MSCPLPFGAKHVYYDDFTDGRGCKACACDASGLSCSGGAVQFHSNSTCTQPMGSPVYPGTICNFAPNGAGGLNYVNGTLNGACAALPGDPTGSVTPASPTTVCCLP